MQQRKPSGARRRTPAKPKICRFCEAKVNYIDFKDAETLAKFQTDKGNCYNFTAAFWALARGIGYDAVCSSGLVGVDRNPHSWVEIEIDGEPRIFDVETEMQYRLIDDYITSMYNIDYDRGALWSYVREPEG